MYYGWKIVATLFVTLLFSSGLGFYNHAVILQALVAEKGLSVTVASMAVSIFFLASGMVGLWIAAGLERYDVRLVISAGAILASLALISIRLATSDIQIVFAYIFFGIGFAASGLLSATTLVTRWFAERRALALSIASTGLSVGGIVITPASALLIEQYGINDAVVVFAGCYLVGVIPLSWLFLKSYPSDIGLEIDGEKMVSNSPRVLTGIPYQKAVKEKFFWGISIAYVFLMLAQVGGLAHQYGVVGEFLTGSDAAFALGVIPIASIIGRLSGGFLLEKYSTNNFALLMMLLQFVSLLGIGLTSNLAGFIVCLAIFGITIGNLLMLQPLLIAETYGQINYSRIYGLSNLLTTVGIASGPFLLGILYTYTGNYGAAYMLASLAGLVGFIVFKAVLKPDSEQQNP